MHLSHSTAAVALLTALANFTPTILAETVWAATVVSRHGQRFPLLVPGPDSLTPYGAHQAYLAGQIARERYISGIQNSTITSTALIKNLSPDVINSAQVNMMLPFDEVMVSSAQAYMQALYPPIGVNISTSELPNTALLANQTYDYNPLNGYQYANIQTASEYDPNYIWVYGNEFCNKYNTYTDNYYDSSVYNNIKAESQEFFDSMGSLYMTGLVANGLLNSEDISFQMAYNIYDFISYQFIHDNFTASSLSQTNLSRLQNLASQKEWSLNGNISDNGALQDDSIRAIAGQTLAAKILGMFQDTILNNGTTSLLNNFIVSQEPMIGFFALAQLEDINPSFLGLPEFGSSMVFELFSADDPSEFPDESDLMVRFLYRNNTDDNAPLIQYSLFDLGPSQDDMTWAQFSDSINNIMVNQVEQWCLTCGSDAIWCAALDPTYYTCPSSSSSHKGLSAPVAGVVGAVVTLAVLGLLGAAAVLFGGVRLHRNEKSKYPGSPKRSSSFGGFKGREKMASDPDLSLTAGAFAPAGAAAAVGHSDHPRGHERVGSWEMKDGLSGGPAGATSIDATVSPVASPSMVSGPHSGKPTRASFESIEDLGPNRTTNDPFA
jgi:hypothetical protein